MGLRRTVHAFNAQPLERKKQKTEGPPFGEPSGLWGGPQASQDSGCDSSG